MRARSRFEAALVGGLLFGAVLVSAPAAAASDAVPSFNESYGCDALNGYRLPLAVQSGYLADSARLFGPAADFFGRTIGDIRDALVDFVVPGSAGAEVAKVHERALPAFELAAANVAAALEAGNDPYAVRVTDSYSFVNRTIGGRLGLSFHAIGGALDINAASNPYSRDNVLITNLPDWWVEAWTDAGFCWGGDWVEVKDPMHFSWKGPAFTPGYGPAPATYPPNSARADFTRKLVDQETSLGPPSHTYQYFIADGDRDGAPDIMRVGARGSVDIVEFVSSAHDFESCGRKHWVYGDDAARLVVGDIDKDSRPDVWSVEDSGPTLVVTTTTMAGGYEDPITRETPIDSSGADRLLAGDVDRDGFDDLVVIRLAGATAEVWSGGDGFQTLITSSWLPFGSDAGRRYALADRDEDDRLDLFALGSDGVLEIAYYSSGWGEVGETISTEHEAGSLLAFDAADYDGDGRPDLVSYTDGGRFTVHLGGSGSWAGVTWWFSYPLADCALAQTWPESFNGTFFDDDGSVHEASIEWAAANGVTTGCNPPYNDMFCPDRDVSRGEMAKLLARAVGLDPGDGDYFIDDDGSIFEEWFDALAEAGVLRGCNPPDNDQVCPDRDLTRAELAAVLVRARDLVESGPGDYFIDDDGSVFELDIDRLAYSGITKGCNPPSNDLFCPSRLVTRAEAATFLMRAFG